MQSHCTNPNLWSLTLALGGKAESEGKGELAAAEQADDSQPAANCVALADVTDAMQRLSAEPLGKLYCQQ